MFRSKLMNIILIISQNFKQIVIFNFIYTLANRIASNNTISR